MLPAILPAQVLDIYNSVGNQYIRAAMVLVGSFLVFKLFLFISEKVILRLTRKTKTEVDDQLVERTRTPLSFIIFFFGLRLALLSISLDSRVKSILVFAIYSLVTIFVAVAVLAVLNVLMRNWGKKITARTKSTLDDHLIDLGYKTVRIVLIILAFLYVLNIWGVEIGPLLAGLGIGGVAIAFALQPTLANIFGGVSMILDKTLQPGDIVEVEGVSGSVIDVGIRSTKIRTWDNEVIIVPNGKLVNSTIKNITKPDMTIRVVIPFGVAYGTDAEKVKSIVMKLIKKVDGLLKEPEPFVRFMEMADSSLNFKAFFYVDDLSKKWPAVDFMNTAIHKEFKKARIEIPFPQMDVHMKKK
jgi:MscS family membrane protein